MPFPSPGDLPNSGIELASPALAGGFFTTEPSGKPAADLEGLTVTYHFPPSPLFLTGSH